MRNGQNSNHAIAELLMSPYTHVLGPFLLLLQAEISAEQRLLIHPGSETKKRTYSGDGAATTKKGCALWLERASRTKATEALPTMEVE